MNSEHKIVVVDDHTIFRSGVRLLISAEPGFVVAGEASDGLAAIECVKETQPQVVLLDLTMPKMNGFEVIAEIKRQFPNTKVVVLTVHETEDYILTALKSGADGYVLKDDTREDLISAIKSVLRGKQYLSPGIAKKMINGYLIAKEDQVQSSWQILTRREREILKLVAEGYKNRQIADQLCISPKTVEKHRSNFMEKLDLHNISEITRYAVDKGLIRES